MAVPRALQLRRHFQRVVLSRPWLTFVVLGLAFSCFGMVTLNLLHLLRAIRFQLACISLPPGIGLPDLYADRANGTAAADTC